MMDLYSWTGELSAMPKDKRPSVIAAVIDSGDLLIGLLSLGPRREGWLIANRTLIGAKVADRLARQVVEQLALEDAARGYEQAGAIDRLFDRATKPIQISAALGRSDLPALMVPPGWVLSDSGSLAILVDKGDVGIVEVSISHRAVLTTGVLIDDDTGDRSLVLEWPGERPKDGWGSETVRSSMTQDPRAFVTLRDRGAPITARNARDLARWIDDLEHHNAAIIPRAHHTTHLGWQGPDGDRGYLWGRNLISTAGERPCDSPPSAWGVDHVRLAISHDDGRSQLADGCAAEGTMAGWMAIVAKALPYPRVLLSVYASLSACLLGLIPSAPNAIVDWSGETSRGKTTTLALAASCWGRPELTGAGLIRTWDVSPAGLEQLAELTCHLPLILDDTKRASTRDDASGIVASLIYQIAAGQGRGRARPDGMRRTATWRTILMSTGEAPATSFTQDAGARARVLAIRGSPFPDDSGFVVAEIAIGVRTHYGHAGPALVRWLLAHPKAAASLREDYDASCKRWAALAGGGAVGGRLAAILALLDLGAVACHDVLGVPRPDLDPLVEVALPAVVQGAGEADRPTAALRVAYAWACKHPTEFWGRHVIDRDESARQPLRGWAGVWQRGPMWTEIAFDPECLVRVLRHEGGFAADDVIPRWRERGWTRADSGRHVDPKISIDGERMRCITITREAIHAIDPE